MRIKRICVVSCGVMSACIHVLMGAILPIAFAILLLFVLRPSGDLGDPFLLYISPIVLPIILVVPGFGIGALFAGCYNGVAHITGGVKVELDGKNETVVDPVATTSDGA